MPSVISTLVKAQIILLNPILNGMDLTAQRKLQDALMALGSRVKNNKTQARDVQLPHCEASWVYPLKERVTKAILYLHGGGYTAGSLAYARGYGGMLAEETGRAALCVGYRLAPEHPFPAALMDALAAYRLMLDRYRPEDILFAGESAGGGLCFCLALKLKEENLPQPAAIVAISPWVDLSVSMDACLALGKDPVLSCDGIKRLADYYLDGHDAKDPLASPICGELQGLPRSLIIAGGDEILVTEAEEMTRKLREAGVPCRLYIEEGMWHVYPLYPVPEAKKAQAVMREFLDTLP